MIGDTFLQDSTEAHTLHEQNLSSLDVSGRDLRHAVFSRCLCTGTRFENTLLDHATFVDTDLSNACFANLTLNAVRFIRCTLDGASLHRVDALDCDFSQSVLHDTDCSRATFVRCTGLTGQTFTRLNTEYCLFEATDLTASRFVACSGQLTRFSNMQADKTCFEHCQWPQWTVIDTSLAGAVFTDCLLDYASFAGARLPATRFEHCSLNAPVFNKTLLQGAVLDGHVMSKGQFVEADLSMASLKHCDLRFADFSHAILTNADISYSDLRFANLHEARYAGLCTTGTNQNSIRVTDPARKKAELFNPTL